MDPIIIDLDSIEDAEIDEIVTGVSMSIAAHPYATSAEVVHMILTGGVWGYRVSFGNGHADYGKTFPDNTHGGHVECSILACDYARRVLAHLERQRVAREDLERQLRERGRQHG